MQDDEGATSNLDSLELDPNMSVPQALLPAVESTLQTAGRWHFDAFQLEEATSGRPLSSLGFYLIGKLNLVREFGEHFDGLHHINRSSGQQACSRQI